MTPKRPAKMLAATGWLALARRRMRSYPLQSRVAMIAVKQ